MAERNHANEPGLKRSMIPPESKRTFFEDYIPPTHPLTCPQCAAETNSARPFCDRCSFDLRYGSLGDRRKGICIYCGQEGKLSEEHVFAKWIQGVFPKRHAKTMHRLSRPESSGNPIEARIHETETSKRADPYDLTIRNVCEACNNGWMSNLQIAAKPFVEALAGGNALTPVADERTVIARWVVMTSMSLQSLGRQLYATQEQRSALKNGNMPSGWRVAMGLMATAEFAGLSISRNMLSPVQVGPGQFLPAQMSLFIIERAVFQTFSSLGDLVLPYAIDYSGIGAQAIPMQPVWPVDKPWDGAGQGLARDDLARIPQLLKDRCRGSRCCAALVGYGPLETHPRTPHSPEVHDSARKEAKSQNPSSIRRLDLRGSCDFAQDDRVRCQLPSDERGACERRLGIRARHTPRRSTAIQKASPQRAEP